MPARPSVCSYLGSCQVVYICTETYEYPVGGQILPIERGEAFSQLASLPSVNTTTLLSI